MKSTFLSLLLLFLYSPKAAAQYESILQDPNIIWAAEVDLTFWIEPEFSAPDSIFTGNNSSMLLKAMNNTNRPVDGADLFFSRRLFDLLLDNNHPVYARPESTFALTANERDHILQLRDTFTVMNLVTGLEENKAVLNAWSYESIQQIKVRQLIFYNDKTDEFDVYTIAFAPLVRRNYGSAFSEDYYTFVPFWFKMPPYSDKEARRIPNLNDPNISWARRMGTGTNMPALDSLRPRKDFKPPVMQQCLDRIRSDPKFEVKEGFNWTTLSLTEREQLLSRTDTLVTFDPETYEEKVLINRVELSGQDIMQLRLSEDWFFDEKLKYPVFRLYAFAPMMDITDFYGNIRFKQPVFWRVVQKKQR